MENLYQVPRKGSSTKKERDLFWQRIIEDQKKSGLSVLKFCQQHHLSFSTFKHNKYNPKALDIDDGCHRGKANENGIDKIHFIPLQAIVDEQARAIEDIGLAAKLIFRNGHAIEISLPKAGNALREIIKEVSQLPC